MRPDDARAHTNLGAILHLLGRPTQAAISYKEALLLQPGDPTTLANLDKLGVTEVAWATTFHNASNYFAWHRYVFLFYFEFTMRMDALTVWTNAEATTSDPLQMHSSRTNTSSTECTSTWCVKCASFYKVQLYLEFCEISIAVWIIIPHAVYNLLVQIYATTPDNSCTPHSSKVII